MLKTKKELFLELAKPGEDGFSRIVHINEFTGEYASLQMGNGGDWGRDDGPLGKEFNIKRIKEKGKIIAVSLEGRKKNPTYRSIDKNIKDIIKKQRCVILYTGEVEVDHKDGRYDANSKTSQKLEDFQPLSKAANNAKRQHCKNCKETGLRFDAKNLGYSVSVLKGSIEYNGSCIGCYWYDPKKFNEEISKK